MITSPDIRIIGGGLHLFGRLNIDTGKLMFQEICSTDLSIGIGSSNLLNKMAIDNSVLNNIIADLGSNQIIFYIICFFFIVPKNIFQPCIFFFYLNKFFLTFLKDNFLRTES
jgi:hypothetical protein